MENLYDVKISGVSKLNGGNYKNITIEGVATIFDSIKGENISIEGCCKSNGDISCNKLLAEGTLKCKGSIYGTNSIDLNGLININGNLQGKEIHSNGNLTVGGLMSGDKITLLVLGTNKIKEIGGEDIFVEAGKKSVFNTPKLVTDSIEGDRVTLENTFCNIVRGDVVTIKSGCNIKRVEYTSEIVIDERSKVSEVIKL